MELRGLAIPESWPRPPEHFPLEMEARLLDLGVRCLRTDEQHAAQVGLTDFLCVVGFVRTQLLGGSVRSGWAFIQFSPSERTLRHRLVQSHQKAMCLRPNLSTLSEYLRSRLQFWTSSEAHAHWRKKSEWIRVWQQRGQSAPRFSSAADQKGKGSNGSAAMLKWSAFCASVVDALE